jgi:hypothetical protein
MDDIKDNNNIFDDIKRYKKRKERKKYDSYNKKKLNEELKKSNKLNKSISEQLPKLDLNKIKNKTPVSLPKLSLDLSDDNIKKSPIYIEVLKYQIIHI